MINRPSNKSLRKLGDWLHRGIVFSCIGLAVYGMVGTGAWFYNFYSLSEAEKQKIILKKVGRLRDQEILALEEQDSKNLEMKDIAENLKT